MRTRDKVVGGGRSRERSIVLIVGGGVAQDAGCWDM